MIFLLAFLLSIAPVSAQVTLRGEGTGDLREQLRRITARCEAGMLHVEVQQRFKNEGRRDRALQILVARPALEEAAAPEISLAGGPFRPLPPAAPALSAGDGAPSPDDPALTPGHSAPSAGDGAPSPDDPALTPGHSALSAGDGVLSRATPASPRLPGAGRRPSPSGPTLRPARPWTLEGRRNLNVRLRQTLRSPLDSRGEGLLRLPLLLRLPTRRADFIDHVQVDLDLRPRPPMLLSLSHPITRRPRPNSGLRVSWNGVDATPHADLLLLGADPGDGALLLSLPHAPDAVRRRHLVVLPRERVPVLPAVRDEGRTVIFLLDVTGSMRGNRLLALKEAVRKVLGELGPGDRFNLIAFSTGTQTLFHDVQAVTPGSRVRAGEFLDSLHGDGACNLDEGLLVAIEGLSPSPPDRQVALCLITDGRPTMGQTDPTGVLRNVRAFAPAGVRIHVACLGYGADLLTAEALADATGGRLASFPEGGDLARFFLRCIAEPIIRASLRSKGAPLPSCTMIPDELGEGSDGPVLFALTSRGDLPLDGLELLLQGNGGEDEARAIPLRRPSPSLRPHLAAAQGPLLRMHHALGLAPRVAALRHGEDPSEALKAFSHAERRLLAACFGSPADRGDEGLALALTDGLGPAALHRMRWMKVFARQGLWIPVNPGRPLALPFGGPALVWTRGRYVDVRLGPKPRPQTLIHPDRGVEGARLADAPWLAEARLLGAEILFLGEEGKASLLLDR